MATRRVIGGKRAGQVLDEVGIEKIADWIAEGKPYRDIVAKLGVSLGALTWWIDSDPERSKRCARAREVAAQMFDEMALEAIESASDPFELAKARERAIHYRWRAKAANPKRYGDRVQQEVTGADGGPVEHSIKVTFVKP